MSAYCQNKSLMNHALLQRSKQMEITGHEIRTAGRVAHNPNIKQDVTFWLQTLETNFFCAGI
jgi:hypothetical protein